MDEQVINFKIIDKTKEIGFIKRFLLNAISTLIYIIPISIFISILFGELGYETIFIFLGAFIITNIRGFYSIIYYLIEIKIIDDKIIFTFMKFNKIIEQNYLISELKIYKGRGLVNLGSATLLLVKKGFTTVFRQHEFHKWTKERLNKIFEDLTNSGMKSVDYIKKSKL